MSTKNNFGKFIRLGLWLGLVLFFVIGITSFNSLTTKRAEVSLQYSQIQVNLQRRVDLIPNYIETVKAEMKHDETIVSMIAQARSNVISTMESSNVSENQEAVENAIAEYDVAVDSYLNFVNENYPELSSGKAFQGLRDELAGSENRIAVSRQYYNEAVSKYNLALDIFPGTLLGPIMGFKHAEPFKAVECSEVAPTYSFD